MLCKRRAIVCSGFLICFSLITVIGADGLQEAVCQATEYKVTLHQLVYLWEDMRFLAHLFSPEQSEYVIVDGIADQLMALHELMTLDIADTTRCQSVDLWAECMRVATDIMHDIYVLAEQCTHEIMFRFYTHAQELNTAIKNQLTMISE
jgi:hypothetical protein